LKNKLKKRYKIEKDDDELIEKYIKQTKEDSEIIQEYIEQTRDCGQLTEEYIKLSNDYTTIKIPLLKILKNINSKLNKNKIILILNDTIDRVNQIVIHTYNFLRLFNLITNQKINNNFIKITDVF